MDSAKNENYADLIQQNNQSMKVNLKNYDEQNKAYAASIGASKLKQIIWFVCSVLFVKNTLIPFSGFRVWVLKMFGAQIGEGVVIRPGVQIKYPWKLTIGDYTWLGEHCWIDNITDVKIGSHVCISQGAMLCTGNHNYKSERFELILKSIILEDGVWIGAKSVVCPGVVAASHSVLTVGSVATKNMESYMNYQGNPAVAVKKRI